MTVPVLTDRDELSPAEQRVLGLVAEGFSDREIAEHLGRSIHTIQTQVRNVLHVLGARNRTHAVSLAWREGKV